MEDKYLLTPQDLERLKKKIKELEEKIIPEYARLLKEARADGDLRENEPFQIMREKLADAKLKLAEYKDLLKNAKVIKPKSKDTVNLGDTIRIEVNGVEQTITIVSEIDANPAENKFPVTSPIAKAVMGKKVGETATLPNGTQVKIVSKVE